MKDVAQTVLHLFLLLKYHDCFGGEAGLGFVDFAKQNITLTGSATILDALGETGLNYCATCNGTCQNNH